MSDYENAPEHAPISDTEALSLLTHDISNTLMVIQNRLDNLRNKYGSDRSFVDIEEACNQSATVLRGAMSVIGKHETPKQLFALGEYLESTLESIIHSANHSLRIRTHRECEIYTAPSTLLLVVEQVLKHYYAEPEDENPSLYIEVYKGSFENTKFGIVQISGPGHLNSDASTWKMLESLMHLQGGEMVINTDSENPQVNLMFPIFQKRQSVYAIRQQSEVNKAMVVEDNKDVADSIAMTLKALGIMQVEVFYRPLDAMDWLENHTPGLVITDYSMFGMTGIEFLKQCESALSSSTVVLISGMPPEEFEKELNGLQLQVEVLMKPLKGNDLLHIVMQSLNPDPSHQQKEARSLIKTVHVAQRTALNDPATS